MTDKWKHRMMGLAEHVSKWSKDPSTQVGAVITDFLNKQVISLGYNGFPEYVEDYEDRYTDREIKYNYVVHAEANAILAAKGNTAGKNLFCTLSPCRECAKLIIQSGIACVFYRDYREDFYTTQMFKEAGVTMQRFDE